MKTATAQVKRNTHTNTPYPNAATQYEIINKFVDKLLTAAMVFAAVTIFLFLFTLA